MDVIGHLWLWLTNCQLKHSRLFYSSQTAEYELSGLVAIPTTDLKLDSWFFTLIKSTVHDKAVILSTKN